MKGALSWLLLITLAGCATVLLPSYVPDKNPYKRKFYADYPIVLEAVKKALASSGWTVTEEADPGVYERRWAVADPGIRHVLLFTDYRESFGIGAKSMVLNAYVRAAPDAAVEIELRYLKVSTVSYKSFYDYKNDKLIEQIFREVEKNLQYTPDPSPQTPD
jgi:hypothetical protein